MLPARRTVRATATGRAGRNGTCRARRRGPATADPCRGGPLHQHRRDNAASEHRGRANQGVAGVLRLPGRPPPRGEQAGSDRADPSHRAVLVLGRSRPWRGDGRDGKRIGLTVYHQDIVDLRCFFEDIAGWGWASAPPRRLVFYGDIPRMPDALPRALPPAL